jgi:hypothetical protein
MLGKIAIILALGAAAWVLFRVGKGRADESKTMFRLKVVSLLAVAAVCFAAKLFPIAFMILLAAGGVTAIELWSGRAIKGLEDMAPGAGMAPSPAASMKVTEAAAVLGVAPDADEEEIKAAHKKLIGQLHPDKGGSDYLAAKINDARRVMLEKRAPDATKPDASI